LRSIKKYSQLFTKHFKPGGKGNMYILGLIWGILVIIGAALVYTGGPGKVKAGSIIGLIFGLLSLLEIAGALYIGFILALIGAILGLVWKPPAKA